MQSMRDDLFGMVAKEWFYTLILGLFGAMALALAALVSMAPSAVVAATGGAIAAAAFWMTTRPVTSTGLLFRVKPRDPLTFALVPAVLLAAALAACRGPARRATRADLVIASRYE